MLSHQDRIKPDTSGILTYLGNIKAGRYQIPTFQRDVVWERENVKKLWDSVYKFFPLGSILVWKTTTKLHSHRRIGGHPLPESFGQAEYQYLLDGQQRTTALYTSIYGGNVAGKDQDPTIYIDLTIPLDGATDDESYQQRFLTWSEIDDVGGTLLRNFGRQKRYNEGLIVRLVDIVENYGAIEKVLNDRKLDYESPERRQLRTMQSVLMNYKLSLIELNGIQVAEVCQIFERINRAGKPLDIFDIVVAKTYRPADEKKGIKTFYLRALLDELKSRDGVKDTKFATLDNHTLLRMLAVCVRLRFPDGGISNVTDRYLAELKAEQIEGIWEETAAAIINVFRFLSNVLRLPGPNLVPYGYFYLTLVAYYFSTKSADIKGLQKYFWYTAFHSEDLLTNTTQLWQHVDALCAGRFWPSEAGAKFVVDRNQLRTTRYSARGRMSTALLALYANHSPKDWGAGHVDVLASVYYTLTDKPNLHHIFPQDFVVDANLAQKERADSLLNIAYLTALTNIKISNKNPVSYLTDLSGANDAEKEDFCRALESHLVPRSLLDVCTLEELPEDALIKFTESRADEVIEDLKRKLEGVPFAETDSALNGRTSATEVQAA